MKINLSKIEENLQTLFESSISLLTGVDYSSLVIHKLITAMEQSVFKRQDGLLTASHSYTIWVSPGMLAAWQSKQDILDQLSNELMKSANDADVVFSYTPVIKLAVDNNHKKDQISITASQGQRVVEETSAITLNIEDDLLQKKTPTRIAFLIRDGSTLIPISENPFNIGRRPGNHLVIDDPRVSRSHAQIRTRLKKYIVFDLNSLGGTFVNGQRIYQHELKPGDVISFSGISIIYSEEYQADLQDTGGYTTTIDVSDSTGNGEDR